MPLNAPARRKQFSGCAVLDLGGLGFVAGGGPDPGAPPKGTLKVVTTNMLPATSARTGFLTAETQC